jgi:hypothetical protein
LEMCPASLLPIGTGTMYQPLHGPQAPADPFPVIFSLLE